MYILYSHLFKEGIKPTWEDPQNKSGGKWMVLKHILHNPYYAILHYTAYSH